MDPDSSLQMPFSEVIQSKHPKKENICHQSRNNRIKYSQFVYTIPLYMQIKTISIKVHMTLHMHHYCLTGNKLGKTINNNYCITYIKMQWSTISNLGASRAFYCIRDDINWLVAVGFISPQVVSNLKYS